MVTMNVGGIDYTGKDTTDILAQVSAALKGQTVAPVLDISKVFVRMTPTSGGGYYGKDGTAGGVNLTKNTLLALFTDAVETARVIAARIVETPVHQTAGSAAGFDAKTGKVKAAVPAAVKVADAEVLAAAKRLLAELDLADERLAIAG